MNPVSVQELARSQAERLSPYLRSNLGWERAKLRGNVERRLVDSLIEKGWVAADVGASAGEFTARLARLVGRKGTVYSFEPLPDHTKRLERLAASRRQIVFHPVGLSNQRGEATLHVPVLRSKARLGLATLRPVEGANAVQVRLERLDDALGSLERLDFAKIDVEGHERSVLEGGAETISRLKPTMMIEIEQRHLPDDDVGAVISLVEGLGYGAEALFPGGLRPVTEFDLERDQLAFVEPGRSSMPEGYVNTFLFRPSG